ncbi:MULTISPECIES: NAD(P)-dependent alcohol dehydrogenase [Paenibacillus]|uniref:NAD(P)-dependent alcohol dehydrogenase n=1 Tax=Paenibacillus violae TaxID=3077234 RepID=A0ABU3RJI0_9BACL|nr:MULTISPECIES: NAD(P)-dependent alcohol dehydrogenase [Paenibacillus]MDU0204359.1 NAD(P)-dependent alcohol dehydrogenase [Paenibacillus sp. PFR10]MEC0269955.1 NAD(P)-dependent alcohol dehydrogenase [Paenibacillus anseongense]
MKAMVQISYGSPEVIVLQQIAKPSPGNKELLIRVQAAKVGPSDCAFRKGNPFMIKLIYGLSRPKFAIGGTELAGVVEAVGREVQHFKPGDRILGMSVKNFGAYAEYKCLSEESPLAVIPDSLTFEEAVGVCDGGATALTFLRDKAKLREGQKVLINGASGAVGIYAVQLAKYYGAEVTAVCSGGNEGLVRRAGADFVIDYTQEDFTKADKAYDVVFDAVGKRSFSASKRVLTAKGIYLTTAPRLSILLQMMWTSLLKGKRAVFATAGLMQNQSNLAFLMELANNRILNAVIDRRYPLEYLPDAHKYVETERKKGNVLIWF